MPTSSFEMSLKLAWGTGPKCLPPPYYKCFPMKTTSYSCPLWPVCLSHQLNSNLITIIHHYMRIEAEPDVLVEVIIEYTGSRKRYLRLRSEIGSLIQTSLFSELTSCTCFCYSLFLHRKRIHGLKSTAEPHTYIITYSRWGC